jgi:hypothetical protein
MDQLYGGVGEWSTTIYTVTGIYGGGFYSLNLFNKKFFVDVTALVGYASSTFPDINGTLVGSYSSLNSTGPAGDIAYRGILGLRYRLSERVDLFLNGDYSYTKPIFEMINVTQGNQAGDKPVELRSRLTLPLSVINTELGFSYRL